MKVQLTLKNGKTRYFNPQVAKVLVARGLGTEAANYQTRELRAEAPKSADDPEALRSELDKRGIKYHHRAGPATLRKLLEG